MTEPLTEPVYSALESPELAKFPRMPRDWEDAIVREIQITHNQFNGKPVKLQMKHIIKEFKEQNTL